MTGPGPRAGLRWPDEDGTWRERAEAELTTFMEGYGILPDRPEAGAALAASTDRRPTPEVATRAVAGVHPSVAARLRAEAEPSQLRTLDGLLAEAALAAAPGLPPREAALRLAGASGMPVADALLSEALRDDALRAKVVEGLALAVAEPPAFHGDGTRDEPSRLVEEARSALARMRDDWSDPSARSIHDVAIAEQLTQHVSVVQPIHCLMRPLFDAAPAEALALLDALPSPLDAAVILDRIHLDVNRFEDWAEAIRLAPPAWDAEGWIGGRSRASEGIALPMLLWRAEDRLRAMADDRDGVVGPEDIAAVVRGREDGRIVAWRWCARLLARTDREDRRGFLQASDGAWRTAQALAAEGGWSDLDPGTGEDALFLEAAQRLAPDGGDLPCRIPDLLPAFPEAFLTQAGTDFSWAAFGLLGTFGPASPDVVPYGIATRLLAAPFLGAGGPEALRAVWHDALVLRELAAGGVPTTVDSGRREPEDVVHVVVALGLAALERIGAGEPGDAEGLVAAMEDMLGEIEPWDRIRHPALRQRLETLRVGLSDHG